MTLRSINRESKIYLDVDFTDADGNAATPTSVEYRVDCRTTGRQLRDWTSVASPAAATEIELSGADTSIVDMGHATEIHSCTIRATYGAGDEFRTEYQFLVRNHREAVTQQIVIGDDYASTETRQVVCMGGSAWPDMTDATGAYMTLTRGSDTITVQGTISQPTGTKKLVTFDLSSTDTDDLPYGEYAQNVYVVLENGNKVTLRTSKVNLLDRLR